MTTLTSFHQFSNLSTELRLNIWEEALAGPSIHMVDVCFPSRRGNDRSRLAFRDKSHDDNRHQYARWITYGNSVFLDCLELAAGHHRQDPSMYQQRRAQRLTCREAASSSALNGRNINIVYLPGRGSKFEYDNDQDVLFLRFSSSDLPIGAPQESSEHDGSSVSNIAEVLEARWTAEMAQTVSQARRIAIDVSETTIPLCLGEIACLASCFQKGLEILYLIDHRTGDIESSVRNTRPASDLQTRRDLYKALNIRALEENRARPPDVIYGVGKTYREVFDLEELSWSESHPAYVFAGLITEAVRGQQSDAGADEFKGVRVLVVQDDGI